MSYYCVTHKNEAIESGELLDAVTSHMVIHAGYEIDSIANYAGRNKVVWLMKKDESAKFGYSFDHIVDV